MSLFGKMKAGLKSVSNRVTGGYGEVSLVLKEPAATAGGTVTGLVTVSAKDELKVTKITARFKGVEKARYSDQYEEDVHAECSIRETTIDQEIELHGEFEMAAGESRDFEAVFQLPQEARPSFKGTHLSHCYDLSVEVDIPWGADLRANEEVRVVASSGQQASTELRRVEQNRCCKAALTISNAKVRAGSYIQYSLIIAPLESIKIEEVQVGLKGMEFMEATLTHWEPLLEDGEEQERRTSHQEDGTIEVVCYEEYESIMENKVTDKPLPLMNTVTIPVEVPGSYRAKGMSSRYYLVATIAIENSEPLEFCEEVIVSKG